MYLLGLVSVNGHHMRKKKFWRLVQEAGVQPLESLYSIGIFRIGRMILEIRESPEDFKIPKFLLDAKLTAIALVGYMEEPKPLISINSPISKNGVKKVEFVISTAFLKDAYILVSFQDFQKQETLNILLTVEKSDTPTAKSFAELFKLYKEVVNNDTE